MSDLPTPGTIGKHHLSIGKSLEPGQEHNDMRKKLYELLRNERFLMGMEIGVAVCTMVFILILLVVLFY